LLGCRRGDENSKAVSSEVSESDYLVEQSTDVEEAASSQAFSSLTSLHIGAGPEADKAEPEASCDSIQNASGVESAFRNTQLDDYYKTNKLPIA